MGLKFRRGSTAQKSGSLAFGEPYVNTDLGTLQIGGATGDITLGASGTGSQGSFAGISGSSLNITGNAKIDGNLTLGGNITIGDNTTDTVAMTANLSSSIIPSLTNTFDLGSASKQWRHVYISTGSLYMNGTPILSSTANELTLTTDTGQSLKLLETSTDTITLQTADGNLTFASSGGGDVVLDPTTGVVSIKGTLQIQDGNKITSNGGNTIQFGNNVAITGSLTTTTGLTVGGDFVVNGTTTTIDSTNINIGDNIIVLNGTLTTNGGMYVKDAAGGNTATGSMLWDTTNDKWIAGPKGSELGILRVGGDSVVSGSSQITYASISSIPAGIVSGSSQTIANLPTGVVSGSAQTIANLPTGTVSGSSQIAYASISSIPAGIVSGSSQVTGIGNAQLTNSSTTIGTTAIALGASSTTLVGLTSVTSTAFVGALTGNASTVTTNANLTGNVTSVGNATTIASGVVTSDMIVDGTIVNGDINASAAIVDTKLATISTGGKVSNSATTATSANTVSAIVARDASGNFSAGTITATLTGNVTGNVTGNTSGTAATVTTAAQSAITSVGTLTSLTVSGATATGALTVTGAVTATGDITAFFTSDKRHKNSIQTISNAVLKVKQLNGVTWEWNDDVNEVTKTTPKTGLIAQEVQQVLPQVVIERADGFLALDYSKMVGLLVEAIKEQQIQIDQLKAQIGSK
jgi:hypothetical protein